MLMSRGPIKRKSTDGSLQPFKFIHPPPWKNQWPMTQSYSNEAKFTAPIINRWGARRKKERLDFTTITMAWLIFKMVSGLYSQVVRYCLFGQRGYRVLTWLGMFSNLSRILRLLEHWIIVINILDSNDYVRWFNHIGASLVTCVDLKMTVVVISWTDLTYPYRDLSLARILINPVFNYVFSINVRL